MRAGMGMSPHHEPQGRMVTIALRRRLRLASAAAFRSARQMLTPRSRKCLAFGSACDYPRELH